MASWRRRSDGGPRGSSKSSAPAGRWFSVEDLEIGGLDELLTALDRLQEDGRACLIRGSPLPTTDRRQTRRLLYPDPQTDAAATFGPAARQWLLLDIDGLEEPTGLDFRTEPEAAVEHVIGLLLKAFHEASWTPPKTSPFPARSDSFAVGAGRMGWAVSLGFFDLEERLAGLSAKGDGLERLSAVVDFELFRPELERAVPRADRSQGGRPPFDHVLMFKVLVLQTQNNLSDERTEFYLRDRLTWMRFLGLGLGDPVPDANTIWTFREALTKAGAVERLFELFDRQLRAAGYLAMSGQLVDATIVAAPKQRNTKAEKQAIKEGRVPEGWQDKPAKLRQKDRDARWTVKYTKAKPREDGQPQVDLAIPQFGYQNHISADRRHRLIRKWRVTDAAAHAGSRLKDLLDPTNTAS